MNDENLLPNIWHKINTIFKHSPGDMYRGGADDDESEEPAWVSSERDQFTEFRDKNKDGVMDEEEVSHLQ